MELIKILFESFSDTLSHNKLLILAYCYKLCQLQRNSPLQHEKGRDKYQMLMMFAHKVFPKDFLTLFDFIATTRTQLFEGIACKSCRLFH